MRFLLALLGLAALVVVALIAFGFMNVSTRSGSLPTVRVEGGQAPAVKASVGTVDVGTKNTQVDVPTVQTETKTIKVPHISVNKPGPAPTPTPAP